MPQPPSAAPRSLIRVRVRGPRGRPAVAVADGVYDLVGPTRLQHLTRFTDADVEAAEARSARLRDLDTMIAMDPATVRTLCTVLNGLDRGQHVLLEGDPATSKSILADYAALLTGRSSVRVSFSQNVREDQLFGSYQPGEDRPVVWGDGPVVAPLVHGGVLILDEINLAPSGIVDRLLPMLERPPTLRLTERDGRWVQASDGFRVVATLNPTDHVGRRALSAALRDRFVEYKVEPPDVVAHEAAVRHWVHGRAAETVAPGSADYHCEEVYRLRTLPLGRRVAPAVARAPCLFEPLLALARVTHSIGQACRDGSIGRERGGGATFGRRQLHAFVCDLDRGVRDARARGEHDLRRRFVQGVQRHFLHPFSGTDRDAVRNLLTAEGVLEIGPLSRRRRAT